MPAAKRRGAVTTPCERFEREALELLEAGEPLPAHFATCPECQKARAAHDRLTALLSRPGEPLESAKWEAGVWDKIDHPAGARSSVNSRPREKATRWNRRLMFGAAASILLFAIVGTFVTAHLSRRSSDHPPTMPTAGFQLALHIEGVAHDDAVTRGKPPSSSPGTIYLKPGDELVFDATTGPSPHAEVRVYHEDDELQLRCPPGCTRDGEHLRGRLKLPAVGSYQAYVVVSEQPLPAPERTLDADTRRLLRAGALIVLGQPVS